MKNNTHKVAVITGASSGMGKDFCFRLLNEGYVVYGAARRIDIMSEIAAAGGRVLNMDVTDDASMVGGVEQIIRAEGRIDVLVNNAGYGAYGAIEDVPLQEARRQVEVNLFGLARLAQLVLPHMLLPEYSRWVKRPPIKHFAINESEKDFVGCEIILGARHLLNVLRDLNLVFSRSVERRIPWLILPLRKR